MADIHISVDVEQLAILSASKAVRNKNRQTSMRLRSIVIEAANIEPLNKSVGVA